MGLSSFLIWVKLSQNQNKTEAKLLCEEYDKSLFELVENLAILKYINLNRGNHC